MIKDRRGVSAILYGLCAAMLIGFLGFSIDLARAWSVRSRLQTAADAAVLMAAREPTASSMPMDAQNLFLANYKSNAPGALVYILGSNAPQITTTYNKTTNVVTSSVSASVPTTFIQIFPFAPKNLTISAVASSISGSTGLEISLVLDNTGSMGVPDGGAVNSDGSPETVLQVLQQSVGDLLNIIYGPTNDTAQDVNVAVVPFVGSINVGTDKNQRSWLTAPVPDSQYSTNNEATYSWTGCVESRTKNNDDENDTPPYQDLFKPYFADPTYGKYQATDWSGNIYCPAQNPSYDWQTTYDDVMGDGNETCLGDNDWNASYSEQTLNSAETSNLVVGPNRGCPIPILSLQPQKSVVMNMVNGMQTSYNGTIVVAGMQGGWFTLSPKWRGDAGWGNPVLPHNYMTDPTPPPVPIQKVIVLVSDGDDVWPTVSDRSPNNIRYNNPIYPTSLYAAYGRLNAKNNPLKIKIGSSSSSLFDAANSTLDARWMQTCKNIKTAGILVYVIGLGVSNTDYNHDRNLLKQCSSGSGYYIESPNSGQLDAAFQQVGHQLSNLRLTQ